MDIQLFVRKEVEIISFYKRWLSSDGIFVALVNWPTTPPSGRQKEGRLDGFLGRESENNNKKTNLDASDRVKIPEDSRWELPF